MIKKFLILLFCQMIFTSFCYANVFEKPQNIEYIAKQIPKMGDINCKFKQEKYLPSSNIKLNSSGNFSFKKDVGITFYTTYPVKTTTTYSSSEYKQINSIISAITNKSYGKLKKEFNFFFEGISGNWNFGLKPKNNSSIKKYLSSIEIQGSNYISKMVITTSDKVVTTIWFSK